MIDLAVLISFSESVVANCDKLKEQVVVSSEAELGDMIQKVQKWPLLVTVMPRSDGDDRNFDNYAEKNSGLFYVLKPYKNSDTTRIKQEKWLETQQAMQDLKNYIREQMDGGLFFGMFENADFGGRSIEPEYNLCGCIGWSLLFDYTTAGI